MYTPKYNFTSEQLRTWYVDQGLSTRQIAALTGAGSRTIYVRLVKAGIPRREPSCNSLPPQDTVKRVTEDEITAWKAELEAGAGIEAVAAKFGRSPNTLRVHLYRKPRLPRPPRASRPGMIAEREERVREMHAQGLRGRQIDRALGWKPGRARYLAQKMGLEAKRQPPPAEVVDWLYSQTGNLADTAKQLGVSVAVARKVLKDAGIPTGNRRRRPTVLRLVHRERQAPGVGRTRRIYEALLAHPEGLSTRQLLAAAGDTGMPRHRALTHCGNVLRRWADHGYVTRAGTDRNAYHNTPSVIWKLNPEAIPRSPAA